MLNEVGTPLSFTTKKDALNVAHLFWEYARDVVLGGRTSIVRIMNEDDNERVVFLLPKPEEFLEYATISDPEVTDDGVIFDINVELPCDVECIQDQPITPWRLYFSYAIAYDRDLTRRSVERIIKADRDPFQLMPFAMTGPGH